MIEAPSYSQTFEELANLWQESERTSNITLGYSLDTLYDRDIETSNISEDVVEDSDHSLSLLSFPVLDSIENVVSGLNSFSDSGGPVSIFKEAITKTAYLAVIDQCIDELQIFFQVDISHNGTPFLSDYQDLQQRFGVHLKTNYDDYVIGYRLSQQQRIRNIAFTLILVFKELADEISVFGAATAIQVMLDNYSRMRQDEERLLEDYKEKQEALRNLQIELLNVKYGSIKQFRELDNQIKKKLMELNETRERAESERGFVKKWEATRQEQNSMNLKLREDEIKDEINNFEYKIYLEQQCHGNIADYLNESQKDFAGGIEMWMEEYDKKFEHMDIAIFNLKNEIDDLKMKKERLDKLYDVREREMVDWLQYRKEKQEQEEKLKIQSLAATKIQAWWRRVMFTKKLGPWRVRIIKSKKNGKHKTTKK